LKENIAAPVLKAENTAVADQSCQPRGTLYLQKLAPTSPTSGSHSVGIVRSRTQVMEFSLVYYIHSFESRSRWRLYEELLLKETKKKDK
jgi:hypothetical protein